MDEPEEDLVSGTSNNSEELVETEHLHITKYPSQFRALANKFAHEKNLKARRKLLGMYGNHLINFKRSILINRRRWQQRFKRRQDFLRSFFMQHLLELETSFLELIPIPILNGIQIIRGLKTADDVSTHISRFYKDVMGLVCEQDWLSRFHMRKSTFNWLCGQLKEIVQPFGKNSFLRKHISYEKQVALGLLAFARGVNYAEIARIFQIPFRTTICKFMKCFAEAIIKTLGNLFLNMPTTEEEYDEIGDAFYRASNMPPAAVGVLGVCELKNNTLKQATSNSNEYENSTIIMQMLIDHKLIFRKVKLDSNQPTLYLDEINEITNYPPKVINNHPVSRFIVTPDTYYPLRKWLMQKYHDPKEPHEFDFNEAVDNLFVFRDRALQRLFARWRILKCNGDFESRTMEKIALACCVLHNLLERNEEPFDKEWAKWLNIGNTKFTMSTRFKPVLNILQGRAYFWEADGAAEVRKFLGRTISSTEM